jgi:hypothetical protein
MESLPREIVGEVVSYGHELTIILRFVCKRLRSMTPKNMIKIVLEQQNMLIDMMAASSVDFFDWAYKRYSPLQRKGYRVLLLDTTLLRAATLNNTATVMSIMRLYLLWGFCVQGSVLEQLCYHGNIELLKWMQTNKILIQHKRDYTLTREAAHGGQLETLKWM